MKTALAASVVFFLSLGLAAQSRNTVAAAAPHQPVSAPLQPAEPALRDILAELQRTTQSANLDLSKLRIERWKADESEKQQMQQVALSLQKNLTMAIPGLINDLQATPGSVTKAFKLYHDLNVVYEFLNSLSDAAGVYGRKEEYTPLASDTSALDNARQSLSSYIEQAATTLEVQAQKPPAVQQQPQAAPTPKKIVIDDSSPSAKKTTRKKKPSPASTPPASQSAPPQ